MYYKRRIMTELFSGKLQMFYVHSNSCVRVQYKFPSINPLSVSESTSLGGHVEVERPLC